MPAFNARPGRGPGASPHASSDANAATDTTASTHPAPPDGAATASRSVTEIVNSLFARFDADDGGTITLSEWLGVVDPDGDGSDRIDTAGAALMTLDTNADGAISNAEVTSAVSALDTDGDRQLTRAEHAAARGTDGTDNTLSGVEALLGGWRGGHGGGPGHGGDRPAPEPVVISQAVTAIFDAYDSDDSGTIAVSELLAALDSHGHAGRGGDAESRVTAAVARIDTNTDGALSAAELTAALTAADTNQDGSVGPGELGPGADVGLVGVLLHHLDVPGIA